MYFILLSHLSSFLIGAYDALCHFPAFPAAVHGGLFDIPVRLRFAHVKPGHPQELRPAYKPCVIQLSLETAGILARSPKSRAHGQKLWQGSLRLSRISQEDSGGSTDRAQILESVPRGCNHYSSGADQPRLHADGVETRRNNWYSAEAQETPAFPYKRALQEFP